MRSPGNHLSVAGKNFTRAHQDQLADCNCIRVYVFDDAIANPMHYSRSSILQSAERVRRSTFGKGFERLAARLHEDDH